MINASILNQLRKMLSELFSLLYFFLLWFCEIYKTVNVRKDGVMKADCVHQVLFLEPRLKLTYISVSSLYVTSDKRSRQDNSEYNT